MWLKDTRTYHVQGWLNQIGSGNPLEDLRLSNVDDSRRAFRRPDNP